MAPRSAPLIMWLTVLAISTTLVRGLLHTGQQPREFHQDGFRSFVGDNDEPPLAEDVEPVPVPDHADVSYSNLSAVTFDVYLPQKKLPGGSPAMVIIHGGMWQGGYKSRFRGYTQSLLEKGIAFVMFDFRESGRTDDKFCCYTWPAQGDDVKDLFRILKKYGSNFGINPDRLGCWGDSSGGHLCNYMATRGDTKLNVAVGMFGFPCFLCSPYTNYANFPYQKGCADMQRLSAKEQMLCPPDWLFGFPDGTIEKLKKNENNPSAEEAEQIQLVHSAEPTFHLETSSNANIPPIFLGQGTVDQKSKPELNRWFSSSLSVAGVPHKLVEEPGGDHGYVGWTNTPIEEAVSFVAQHI